MGHQTPTPTHPPRQRLRLQQRSGSRLGLRLPLSLKMIDGFCGTQRCSLLLLACPGPYLYTLLPLPRCFFHVVLHFFFMVHQPLPLPLPPPPPPLRNKSPYICIYNFFIPFLFIILCHAIFTASFLAHASTHRAFRVIKKQPHKHQRHIKAFPGIKISHELSLTTNHPSLQPSSRPSIGHAIHLGFGISY